MTFSWWRGHGRGISGTSRSTRRNWPNSLSCIGGNTLFIEGLVLWNWCQALILIELYGLGTCRYSSPFGQSPFFMLSSRPNINMRRICKPKCKCLCHSNSWIALRPEYSNFYTAINLRPFCAIANFNTLIGCCNRRKGKPTICDHFTPSVWHNLIWCNRPVYTPREVELVMDSTGLPRVIICKAPWACFGKKKRYIRTAYMYQYNVMSSEVWILLGLMIGIIYSGPLRAVTILGECVHRLCMLHTETVELAATRPRRVFFVWLNDRMPWITKPCFMFVNLLDSSKMAQCKYIFTNPSLFQSLGLKDHVWTTTIGHYHL